MSEQIPISDNVWPLLNAVCDGTLAETQVQELATLLDSDPAVRKVFLDHMQLRRNIRLLGRANRVRDLGLARIHATLPQAVPPGSPSPVLGFFGNAIHGTVGYVSSGWPVAYLVATVIFGIALLVGSLVPVSQPAQVARQSSAASRVDAEPKIEVVGRITGMDDCRFDQRSEISDPKTQGPRPKTLVSLGDTFVLASGLLEITYDTGAKVILQGPVTYQVESKDSGYLSLGKLTARLNTEGEGGRGKAEEPNPQSPIPNPSSLSTIHSSLFTIKTPTAIVTDLGTEFGVEVAKSGETTSHVFRGAVRVQVVAVDGQTEGNGQILRENESARVEKGPSARAGGPQIVVTRLVAAPMGFVREIPKRTIKTFDLVDVVGGGDGFSGRRNHGIDPATGRPTDRTPKNPEELVTGDGKYHRAEGMPFVDGVFIPDGRLGPVRTDSAGHTFEDCPETCNQTGYPIWAAGTIPTASPSPIRTKLGEIDYAASGHGLLFMAPNKGITFDLDAIRQANPGQKLVRFRTVAGNTEYSSENLGPRVVNADFWVLVDGQVRYRRRGINGCSGVFPVAFAIDPKDRFLTLVATDGGNGLWWDWIMFGDPRIELLPHRP